MSDFFYGWRRRLGVLTLLMGLAFMVGWVRSQSSVDTLMYPVGKHTFDTLQSIPSLLVWQRLYIVPDSHKLLVIQRAHPSWSTSPWSNDSADDDSHFSWQSGWRGFGFLESPPDETDDSRATFLFIPYWMVVAPLTLISLWLLLSKPRQSTSKKITEPTAVEGA